MLGHLGRLVVVAAVVGHAWPSHAMPSTAQPAGTVVPAAVNGLSDATVLIVRHAEKPSHGPGLTRRGTARANAYATYFQGFPIDGRPIHIDALIAAADSGHSVRPRLTLAPLGEALSIPVQQPFRSAEVGPLVGWMATGRPGRTLLVAWHHGDVPRLLAELGQDPAALLPDGRWRPSVFDRVIVLRFDGRGAVIPTASRIVKEKIALRP